MQEIIGWHFFTKIEKRRKIDIKMNHYLRKHLFLLLKLNQVLGEVNKAEI